jgi:hypothetical protein
LVALLTMPRLPVALPAVAEQNNSKRKTLAYGKSHGTGEAADGESVPAMAT